VRGADGGRGNTVPFRSPPARDQVPEDPLESGSAVNGEKSRDVLGEDPAASGLAGDSPNLGPQPTGIADSEALSGDGGSLAGEPGNDEIHAIAVRVAVEGFQIVPDRAWIQRTLGHSTCEDSSRVGLPLNSTHSANTGESKADGELEATVAGAEGEEGGGTYNHT
jgi:hypothetical protein